MDEIVISFDKGDFTKMVMLSDSLKIYCQDEPESIRKADSLIDISARIRLDFSFRRDEIIEKIETTAGEVSDEDITAWENKRWLEYRVIDGRKRYFNRAASNLMLLRGFYEEKESRSKAARRDPDMALRLNHTEQILRSTGSETKPAVPVDMLITFTLTVQPDAVPEGETIRCWIPWPKGSHPRQKAPELISASEPEYVIAPDSNIHRSIYMEKPAHDGEPSVFRVRYRYLSAGQYFNFNQFKVLPYDSSSELYKKYTSEQLPQICFTENVRRLADSITGLHDDPVTTVRKIYMWFKENIPWTGALEYSTIPNIPEYVMSNRRGDCGMQTLLFMSMLRYKGIPVRWQSGWMVPPGFENLHDWCEVYFEGTEWVPADVSYDLQDSDIPGLREFYLSGIDSWRLIVNDGIAGSFIPEKRFLRSDPFDFQRGEVEWKGGNLYYDQWDYEMEVEYVK
ncbi:MAG: transglutaminase-like domain-containing protein [Bacteroidota bacterium]